MAEQFRRQRGLSWDELFAEPQYIHVDRIVEKPVYRDRVVEKVVDVPVLVDRVVEKPVEAPVYRYVKYKRPAASG